VVHHAGLVNVLSNEVVLITVDGLRRDHISAFGYSRPTTSNLDWLAANGVLFRNVVPTGRSTQVSLTSHRPRAGVAPALYLNGFHLSPSEVAAEGRNRKSTSAGKLRPPGGSTVRQTWLTSA
jgi:hypothetical protein